MRKIVIVKQGITFTFKVHKRIGTVRVVSVNRSDILGVNTAVDYIRVNATSDLRRVANRWLGGSVA